MKSLIFAVILSVAFTCSVAAPLDTIGPFESIETLELLDDSLALQNGSSINITLTLECIKGAIQQVAQDNNLDQLWEQTRQRLRAAIQRLRACKEHEDPETYARCVRRELNNAVEVLRDFCRTLFAADRLDILTKIRKEVVRQCRTPSSYESVDFSIVPQEKDDLPEVFDNDLIEHFKCAIRVIDEAVKESSGKIGVIWQQTKTQLDAIQQNLRRCRDLPSQEEIRKCIGEQLKAGGETVLRFFKAVAEEDGNLLKKIKDQIQKECY